MHSLGDRILLTASTIRAKDDLVFWNDGTCFHASENRTWYLASASSHFHIYNFHGMGIVNERSSFVHRVGQITCESWYTFPS